MIRMIKIEKGGYRLWNINGREMRFRPQKNTCDELFCQTIAGYCDLVRSESYKDYPDRLCEIAVVAGEMALIRIGLEVFQSEFLRMFGHYATEEVAEQIDAHLDKLAPIHALLYQIFSNTGMRTKEVLFLEEDCLEPSRFDNLVQLKYMLYKTLTTRRKKGISDYSPGAYPDFACR